MSELVNLRITRRQRQRAEARAEAGLRATAAGETKSARRRRETAAAREARRLDQHRIERLDELGTETLPETAPQRPEPR